MASNKQWTTERSAIIEGAKLISDKYINNNQFTLYMQKYNVNEYAESSQIVNQYATAIHMAYTDR